MSTQDDYADAAEVADLHDEIDKLRARNNVLYELSNRVRDEAAASAAELVGLREQLARQARLCDAAVRHADAVEAYSNQGVLIDLAVDRERDQSAARLQYEAFEFAAAVRALPVPAPPEATEVTG